MSRQIEDKKIKDLIHTIGLNNNLTDEQVREIVEAPSRFTYQEIRKLEIQGIPIEEVDNLKKNFYFKYIGKLYTDSEVVTKLNNKANWFRINIKEKDGRKQELELGGSDGNDTDISLGANI